MSFLLESMRHKPLAFWNLDDDSPFTDASGYNRSGSSSAQPAKHISLATGAQYASVFSRDCIGTFAAPVFNKGYEDQAFTLGANIRGITNGGGPVQAYHENRNPNPSLENASGYAASVNGTNYVFSYDTTTFVNGTRSAKLTRQATALDNIIGYMYVTHPSEGNQFTVNLTVGEVISVGCMVKSSVASQARLNCVWRDSSSNGNGSSGGAYTTLTANTWTWVKAENITVPAGTTHMSLRVDVITSSGNVVGGETMNVDSVMVNSGPTVNGYFDGSVAGYEWAGTTDGSVSRTRTDVSKINWSKNPRVTQLNTPSNNNNFWTGAYNVALPTPTPDGITTGFRSTVNSSSAGTTVMSVYNIDAIGRYPVARSVGFWVMTPHSGYQVQNINNGVVSWIQLTPNVWQWTVVDVTPSGAWASVYIQKTDASAAAIGDVAYLTGVVSTPLERPTYFFDGRSAGAAWSGTADQSASIMYISDGEQQILGNNGQMDGLVINGTKIAFTTKYAATGQARAEYDLQVLRAFNVFGVHTSDRNSLYIDGELVAQADISDVQKADSLVNTDNNLYSGASTTGESFAANSFAVYGKALSDSEIASLAASARTFDSSSSYGGQPNSVAGNSINMFLNQTFDSDSDWKQGISNNVIIQDGYLEPTLSAGVSLSGNWLTSIALSTTATSVYSIVPMWDGEGALIEASLDGTNWVTLVRGRNISLVTPGFNPTNAVLQIRVSFAGGIADDPSYLDSLTLTGYTNNTVTTYSGNRNITYLNAHIRKEDSPMNLSDMWGVELVGGKVTISAETADSPTAVKTREFWIKKTSSTAITVTPAADTVYVNGAVSSLANIRTGEWSLVHLVNTTGFTTSTDISGDMILGTSSMYDYALSATDVANVYKTYTMQISTATPDISVIGITEPATASDIYAYDWSVTPAG